MIEREATFTEIERLTGITYKTIKKRLEDLKPVRRLGAEIFFDLKFALPLLYGPKDKESFDLTQQRARLAKVQADKIEIETKKLLGNLVDIKEWEEEFSRALVSIKDSFKNMGLRLSDVVTGLTTREEVYETINEYVNETLHEISNSLASKALENMGKETFIDDEQDEII